MNPSQFEKPDCLGPDETLDTCEKGPVRIIQKKRGYRFSLDSLILADFVRLKGGSRILDLGTGSAVISLILTRSRPDCRITALELSADFIGLARRNISLNGLGERIHLLQGDICRLPFLLKRGIFDAVVSNPPYRPLETGRINPQPQKALARHEIRITLPALAEAAAHGLKPGGKWFVIYPAWRMASLLALSRQQELEPKRIRLVHSLPDKEAVWVLMEAVSQGREELKVLPPLIIYRRSGVYSREAQEILSVPNPDKPEPKLRESSKIVAKPAPECLNPGVKTGVQGNY